MKIQQGEELLQPFISASKASGNPFLISQFSKEDGEYRGYHGGLDRFDAIMIMKHLVSDFNMTELDAAIMGFKPIFQPEY